MAIRNDIKAKLRLDLATLTLEKVYKYPVDLDKVTVFPSASIMSMPEVIKKESEGLYKREALFAIVFYYYTKLSEKNEDNFEEIIEDFYEEFLGLEFTNLIAIDGVESIEPGGIDPYPTKDGKGYAILPLKITYY